MIGFAVVCTILGGILGAFLEPDSLSMSIPVAIMGGFILKALQHNQKNTQTDQDEDGQSFTSH